MTTRIPAGSASVLVALLLCSSAFGQTPFVVTKLIGDLNDNVESNKKARAQLVQMGRQAVPGLLEEIAKYSDLNDSSLFSAARCLRVLREMKSDDAVDVAIEMLSALSPPLELRQASRVALAEAVAYLADCFQSQKVNETFSIKTSYAELRFKAREIARLQVQTAATKTDDMELRVGDRLSGTPRKEFCWRRYLKRLPADRYWRTIPSTDVERVAFSAV